MNPTPSGRKVSNVIDLQVFDSSSDEALMLAVQNQQGRGLEELYRRHAAVLRAVIIHSLHQDADADDVLQDVFVEFWARSEKYLACKGAPLGWMITIARRRAIDRIRRNQARNRAAIRAELEHSRTQKEAPVNPAEVVLDTVETHKVIVKILNSLPKCQYQAIELAYFRDLSQRQIAATTGIPVGTIKTRLQLAHTKIERALKGVSRDFVATYVAPVVSRA